MHVIDIDLHVDETENKSVVTIAGDGLSPECYDGPSLEAFIMTRVEQLRHVAM